MTSRLRFNPFSSAFQRNPYPIYAELRREAPVLKLHGGYVVSRFEDVSAILMNPSIFSSATSEVKVLGRTARLLLQADPPEHTKLRSLLGTSFFPGVIRRLEPQIKTIIK